MNVADVYSNTCRKSENSYTLPVLQNDQQFTMSRHIRNEAMDIFYCFENRDARGNESVLTQRSWGSGLAGCWVRATMFRLSWARTVSPENQW
jgi:hypothetical protein